MNIQTSSDNITISESMKVLIESKLQKLEKRWSELPQDSIYVRVVANSAPEDKFSVKIDVDLNGEKYYTEGDGYELESAIIDAVSEIDRQYQKDKGGNNKNEWEEKREDKRVTEEDLESEIEASEDFDDLE